MSLAIFAASCGFGINILNAEGKLRSLGSFVAPLFVLSGAAILFAIYTAFFSHDEEKERERKKVELRRQMRNLKREFRQTHHVATAFILGAEYYVQHITAADAYLMGII